MSIYSLFTAVQYFIMQKEKVKGTQNMYMYMYRCTVSSVYCAAISREAKHTV